MDELLPDGTPTRTAIPCRRCGGWLVSAESRAARLGPTCARHERAEARRAALAAEEIPLFEIDDQTA
ncbi:DUF6011 domain-containing protein [Nocardia farcinica]|uniref:DUF6011 domain-containing protein n=1 Tax=Nocardia farcinica TaxID=37329 RepID=UPI0034210252